MTENDLLSLAFEAERDRLRAVAYRMLGSHADAEDVVQEAWLRLARQEDSIENLAGWLTTVVGRLSLDVLRGRRSQPGPLAEEEPELTVAFTDEPSLEDEAALADSVGIALLVVLDSLKPSERLAFVLHDLFAVPFEEIGQLLGRSTDATKMLASRARRKVRSGNQPASAAGEERAVVDAFLAAARSGDFEGLLKVLDPEVRLNVDTGDGPVITLGATKVAASATFGAAAAARSLRAVVNGLPGLISWSAEARPLSVMAFTVMDGRITAISTLVDPVRLAKLDLPMG